MLTTKHISLDDTRFEKMKPYLEKYNGNFSSALKDIINEAGKYGSRSNSSAIDVSLFSWMQNELEGRLIPGSVLDEIIDPALATSISGLEGFLNNRFHELEWDADLTIKPDNDALPSNIQIEIRCTPQTKFVASLICQYLVKNSMEKAPLEIEYVLNINNNMKIKLSRSGQKEAQQSLVHFFGGMEEPVKIIKSRPAFWNGVIRRHLSSNYNMVTLHRNCFEDLFAGKIPASEIMIENLAKRSVKEIPLVEMLPLIKEIYENSKIVDRVDIENDTILISHDFRNKDAIEKLVKSLVMLLESSGHLYFAKQTANMIVLTHRPDVGIKINEIVNNLKTSGSKIDQELIIFMTFLEGLKDMPDIPFSLTALGRRMGTTLMKEYEKENGIKNWNVETFQKALQGIDSRLHRESEWKVDGKNLLYTIRKCQIAGGGNTFDKYKCHAAREAFKGAMDHAFGNKAELFINKLLTRGDSFCEVVIRAP
jgi:hypothetical protein